MTATRQREPRIRMPKVLKDAKGQVCQLCGADDGTVVNAHCNDMEFRGIGMKAPDFLTAWLCNDCHDIVDGRSGGKDKAEKRALWMLAFARTVAQRFRQGLWRADGA